MAREKTGGRQKGTPNKLTSELRTSLKAIIENELEQLPKLLNEVNSPTKRIELVIKLMPFVFPKVTSVYADDGEGDQFTFSFGLD